MNFLGDIINFLLHVDNYIELLIQNFGYFTYAILFGVIFFETGVVVTPFLPGDSLIFLVGAFAAKGSLNLFALLIILSVAAILGDSLNYSIGKYLGKKIEKGNRFIKRAYLEKTEKFYDKYGGKAIILARFIPIVRTFAPFVAGVGKMDYKKFISYNIIGGIAWVALFLFGGYFFGTIPFVKNNMELVIILIILASFIPPVFEYIRHKIKNKSKSN